ncbi:hypothetical protein IIA16_02990 [bacterium]|nr:hypothetical protein [bacterium]
MGWAFAAFFVAYLAVAVWLRVNWGYISTMDLFLDERVLLAIKGNPPLVENIGMTYPPLPFLLRFPVLPLVGGLTGPFLSAFFAAATVMVTLWALRRAGAPPVLGLGFSVAYLLHLPFLMAATDGEIGSIYAFLLVVSVLGIGLFLIEKERTAVLAASGIALGLLCAVRYEAVFIAVILALVAPAVLLKRKSRQPWLKTASLLFVWAIPAIFFFFAWIYMNKMFMGDGLYFLHGPNSYLQVLRQGRPPQLVTPIEGVAWGEALLMVGKSALIAAPLYLWAMLRLRSWAGVMVGLVPLLAEATTLTLGWSLLPATRIAALLPLAAVLLALVPWRRLRRGRASPVPELLLLALGVFTAPALLARSIHPNENAFVARLIGRDAQILNPAERAVAEFLSNRGAEEILMDDAVHFRIVAFHGKPRAFILPYQPHFAVSLSNPREWATWIVVSPASPELDRVLSANPDLAYAEQAAGFGLAYEVADLRVYRRLQEASGEPEADPVF